MRIVPPTMRPAMLEIIHETHLGTVRCKQKAREALHWPGMSAQIKEKVKDCSICHDHAPAQCKEFLNVYCKFLNSRAPMDNSTVCIEGITLAK